MGADKKNARRQRAHLIFIDESGLLMAPLVRRTWGLRGHRPVLYQRGKEREKVSLSAALWWSPWKPPHLGLFYRSLVNAYFNNQHTAEFLEMLMRELPQRLTVVWNGGPMHKGNPIREAVDRFHPRLTLERLPPYAPMLNPVEPLWSWLKYSRLCNFAPHDAQELRRSARKELDTICQDTDFLESMWHASELPLPRALLL
jgi:transposase